MSHLYKRGERWYIKYYHNSKPHYRSLGTKTLKRARSIQREIDKRLDAGIIPIPERGKNPEVNEFWKSYLQWAIDHKRPNTIAQEQIVWNQLIKFTKIQRLGDLIPDKIESFKRKRLEKDSISKSSINNWLKHMHSLYNHAKKLGLYNGENPFDNVELYSLPKSPPKHLQSKQISVLFEKASEDSKEAYMIFALGILAGMRKSEIDNAKWEWFDFKGKLINIQSDESFVVKDRDARSIPLCEALAAILIPHREDEGYLLKPQNRKPGKSQYRYDFRRLFTRVVENAGVSWVTPHILRHTFGSILADSGVSLYKIMKWMGHSDIHTTMGYAHLQDYDDDINRFEVSLAKNPV